MTQPIGLGLIGSGATGSPVSTSPFGPTAPVSPSGPIDLSTITLTPAQLDLINFTGEEMDTRTRDIYSRLGLGGSTMQTQDLSFDALARSAFASGLLTTNEQLALANAELATRQNIASGNQATQQNIQAGRQSLTQGNRLLGQVGALGSGLNQLATSAAGGAGFAAAAGG
jgi:hypothetical protein